MRIQIPFLRKQIPLRGRYGYSDIIEPILSRDGSPATAKCGLFVVINDPTLNRLARIKLLRNVTLNWQELR